MRGPTRIFWANLTPFSLYCRSHRGQKRRGSQPNNTFLNNIFLIKITTLAASPFSARSAAGGWSGPSPGRPLHPSRASLPPATQPPRPTPRCWPPAASSSAPRAATPVATAPRSRARRRSPAAPPPPPPVVAEASVASAWARRPLQFLVAPGTASCRRPCPLGMAAPGRRLAPPQLAACRALPGRPRRHRAAGRRPRHHPRHILYKESLMEYIQGGMGMTSPPMATCPRHEVNRAHVRGLAA
jgi:hypothetical protein